MRMRFPIVMLSALLVAIVVLSVFTIQLLRDQRSALDEAVRESRAQAMSVLALRVEQSIRATIRPAFLVFKNVPYSAVQKDDFAPLRSTIPELSQVLFLDQTMRLKRALPKPGDRQEKFLDQWLARRAALEHGNLHLLGFSLRTFVENFNGKPALFALQPANNVDPSAGWLLMRFDLPSVRDNRIRPLLQAFIKEQGGSIQLQGPEDPWDDDALNWPVGQVLPGWLLVYKPDPAAQQQQVDRGSTLILVELGGSLLAIVLAIFSGWREVRREHAMIDLRNRFVANVSHELKTPLTLIRMYAETLYLGRITDASKQHQYHRTILREAERLTRMITAVLDFGRLNQGINVYQLTDEDLGETVEQVLVRYAFRIEEADMCLETQLEPDLPAVPHDRNGVTQILLNLIDNAIKYGASGGKLLVTLRRKGNGVELAVTDYGPGIPVSKHGKAVRDVDAANASGSGLGLALVEQIVKAHHAQLKFEVPDGAGTRASITFATGSQA